MAALKEEHRQKPNSASSRLVIALRDLYVYVITAGWAMVLICSTILDYWTPTTTKQTSIFNILEIGFLSALLYVVGAAATLLIVRSSDVRLERRQHFFLSTTADAAGVALSTMLTHNLAATIACLNPASASYFAATTIIWTAPSDYLKDEAVAGGIGVISSLGQVSAFFALIVLGRVRTVTGSFSAGILLVTVLVFAGGITVFFDVPCQ